MIMLLIVLLQYSSSPRPYRPYRSLLLLRSHILSLDDFFNEFDVVLVDLGAAVHHPRGAHRGRHLRRNERREW